MRDFAGRRFVSTQERGVGRFDGLLCERFGPFAFGLALLLEGERLSLVVRRWTFLGLPLPRRWAPSGDVYETVDNGRFRFHVDIAHPLLGRIVRYRGWLVPTAADIRGTQAGEHPNPAVSAVERSGHAPFDARVHPNCISSGQSG